MQPFPLHNDATHEIWPRKVSSLAVFLHILYIVSFKKDETDKKKILCYSTMDHAPGIKKIQCGGQEFIEFACFF